MQQLTIVTQGGLCNRLRVALSALYFSQHTSAPVRVEWMSKHKECFAHFTDLFEPIASANFRITPMRWWNRPVERKNLHLPALMRLPLYNKQIKNFLPSKHGEIGTLLQQHHRLYLSTCSCIMDYPREVSNALRPVTEIQQQIDAITQHFTPRTIGVHIRRTDNKASISGSPTSAFIEAMKKELSINSDTHFFVATDDTDVRALLQHTFPGRIITQEFHKCHRDTLNGMKQAVVDLFCLAKTNKIIGSYWSSFTDMAAEIGNVTLLIAGRTNAQS